MKIVSIIFLGTIHVLALCGCSTTQPIDTDINQEGFKDWITAGDEIVIYTKPHRTNTEEEYTLVVKTITEEKITGEDRGGLYEMEFNYSDIEAVQKRGFYYSGETLTPEEALTFAEVIALIFIISL